VRLVVDELRTDVTKTRKDGGRGRLRVEYTAHRDPQAAIAWLWKFLDGAKTAGELYGRALVVIAAEQHATQLVVPASQRMPSTRWSSHKDVAAKALRKLAGPHPPASLSKLEQAVKRAHRRSTRPSVPTTSSSAPSASRSRPSPTTAWSTTRSTTTRSGPHGAWADPPPEVGTPWRACDWRGIGPRTGRGPPDRGDRRCLVASTVVP
jgi:hypothetical protein